MLCLKSPFPGMDPYVERHWRDFHHSLCTYASDTLQPQLRPQWVARIDERIVGEQFGLCAYTASGNVGSNLHECEARAPSKPIILRVLDEQTTEGFVQIINSKSGRVMTVIEFLTPSVKVPGDARNAYCQKQHQLRAAGVSLVEVNLIRAGEWAMQLPQRLIPPIHQMPYGVVMHRAWRGQEFEYYPIPLDSPLPTIRIPVDEGAADVQLDLQHIVERAYTNGAYDTLDYRRPLDTPFDEPWGTWVRNTLRNAGRL